MFRAIVGLFLLLWAVPQAFAADLPSRAVPPVFVAPAEIVSWSGCYAGGFGAYDIARVRSTRDEVTTSTTVTQPTAVVAVIPPTTTTTAVPSTSSSSRTFNGADGGGRIGCNYEMGKLVIGGQIEGGYLGINGTTVDPLRTTSLSTISGGAYGAASVKLGTTLTDRTLLFVRGGVGYANLRYSATDFTLNYTSNVRGSEAMPLAGVGLEYKISPNISVTGEYTYMRPGCRSSGVNYTRPGTPVTTAAATVTTDVTGAGTSTECVDKHMISLGLNYYFNTPGVPVIARY